MPHLRSNSFVLDAKAPVQVARELMHEYAAELKVDLCFQNFERELALLPGAYAEPAGCLLVAFHDGQAAGCGAFRFLQAGVCEMKRLYVRPAFRGLSLGRFLAAELMVRAQTAGYRHMKLDTLASLQAAIQLYHSLGFRQVPPYNETPLSDCLFFEATLPGSAVP